MLAGGGAAVDLKDNLGRTALVCACHHGRKGAVKVLLAAAAVMDAKDNSGSTALMGAGENGDESTLQVG